MSSNTARHITAMRADGYGYAVIARALNERQVPTSSGRGQWYPASVRAAAMPGYWAAYKRRQRRG